MSGQGEHCLQYISVMQCPVIRLTLPEGALQTLSVSHLCVGHQKGCIGVGRGFKARAPHYIQHRPGTVYVTGKEEREGVQNGEVWVARRKGLLSMFYEESLTTKNV